MRYRAARTAKNLIHFVGRCYFHIFFIAGKACDYCQRLFSWGPKVTSKDVKRGQKLLESGASKGLTLSYLEHLENCKNSRLGIQEYPDKGELLKFRRAEALHPHPMYIYLDFETSNCSLAEVITSHPINWRNSKQTKYFISALSSLR